MTKKISMHISLFILMISMAGCSSLNTQEHASQLAKNGHLKKSTLVANGFVLTAYSRLTKPEQAINIYIEGDGLAWLSRHQLSADPTPRNALALALAALDPTANVVYLARPCQFNDFEHTPCASEYWSNKRFSPKVIDALNQEIDSFARPNHAQKINLIGYSGGAAVAVLLAERRSDVASLRTVAGNLDHAYVNNIHQVDLTPESLNAIAVADNVSHIPQLHFVGLQDNVIPKEVAVRFIGQQKSKNCSALLEVEATHQEGWVKQWQQLLLQPLPC